MGLVHGEELPCPGIWRSQCADGIVIHQDEGQDTGA